jgi:hypothetical protein
MARKTTKKSTAKATRGVDRPDPTQNPPILSPLGLALQKLSQIKKDLAEVERLIKQANRGKK